MNDLISIGCTSLLCFLIIWTLYTSIISKDVTKIWSPLTTISLVYIYYCLWPYYLAISEKHAINEAQNNGYLFHMASLLSYVCILIGFKIKAPFTTKRWNKLMSIENCNKYGIILVIIAMACYVPFRGFHLSIAKGSETVELEKGGFIYYLIFMTDILAAAMTLLYIKGKHSLKTKLLPMWIIIATFLYSGGRWRIVVMIISILTMMHLYPKKKKPNYGLIAILGIVLFLGFSAMDALRTYNQGIDFERASELDFNNVKKGAGENYDVYSFSMQAMNKVTQYDTRIYFLPLLQAVLMPIPRFLFPAKPNADYLHQMENIIIGDDTQGAAFLNFVEGYMSFGWIGVIIYGIVLGWVSKLFWNNYKKNPDSIGAILLLGLFSGVSFSIVSRGDMASTLVNILYVICLPFLLLQLLKKIKIIK